MSDIDTGALRKMLSNLEEVRSRLEVLHLEAAAISTNAQTNKEVLLNIRVGSSNPRAITLSREHTDQQTYRRSIVTVRGAEMILLGVKKWYAAEIARAEQRLAEIEAQIATHTRGAP